MDRPAPFCLENRERRKQRDPEILVWDRLVRGLHWLLALAFAALYLEYRKFPLHPYAGYLVLLVVLLRIGWGFAGSGAARFSAFWFSPREVAGYLKQALRGQAAYHFSHNPLGAAMVYVLLALLLANTFLGLLAYSASQQLGPFGAAVPPAWEDRLIFLHAGLGHLLGVVVAVHMAGVVWAAWLHRENYVMAMLTGIRRIPRSLAIPEWIARPVPPPARPTAWHRLCAWLSYRSPVLGSLLLMNVMVWLVMLPLIQVLVRVNKVLPAY